MKKTLLIAAAFAAIPTATLAQEVSVFSVDSSGIDLTTEAGQKRLDSLVQREIRRTCETGDRGLSATADERECRDDLRSAARGVVEAARAATSAPR